MTNVHHLGNAFGSVLGKGQRLERTRRRDPARSTAWGTLKFGTKWQLQSSDVG